MPEKKQKSQPKVSKTTKKVSTSKTVKPSVKKTMPEKKEAVMVNKAMPAKSAFSMKTVLKSSKTTLVLLGVLLVVALLYFLKDQIIVATVNGKPITRFTLMKSLEKQGGSQVLSSLTTEMLVRQAIKDAGVTVDQSEVDAELTSLEDSIKAQGQDLDTLLLAQNMTRKDIEDQIRLSKEIEKILADKLDVTDQEVADYFEKNKASLGTDATLEMYDSQIREQLRQQKLSTAQQEWLSDLQKNASIKYYRFAPSSTSAY
jgi:parvulin-like peptidyl-prolyl isomerase